MPNFILLATADNQPSSLGSTIFSIGLIVVMVAIFYFLIIRPQKKQEKQQSEMRSSIKVGDEIVTIGGIIGTVIIAKDDKLMIETGNDKSKLTILRSSVKSVYGDDEAEK